MKSVCLCTIIICASQQQSIHYTYTSYFAGGEDACTWTPGPCHLSVAYVHPPGGFSCLGQVNRHPSWRVGTEIMISRQVVSGQVARVSLRPHSHKFHSNDNELKLIVSSDSYLFQIIDILTCIAAIKTHGCVLCGQVRL